MDFALSPRAEELRKRLGPSWTSASTRPRRSTTEQIAESGDPHATRR